MDIEISSKNFVPGLAIKATRRAMSSWACEGCGLTLSNRQDGALSRARNDDETNPGEALFVTERNLRTIEKRLAVCANRQNADLSGCTLRQPYFPGDIMALQAAATVDSIALASIHTGVTPDNQWRASPGSISWGAVLAGAAAAAALSLILLMLGIGLGLSSISPWANEGVSARTFGVSTILWITLTQLVASGMGGYLAGRLRTRWVAVQSDEVHFRDTAHGFLAWAVASLATAALLSSAIGSIVNGGVQAGATVAGGVTAVAGTAAVAGGAAAGAGLGSAGSQGGSISYFVDALMRRDPGAASAAPAAAGVAVASSEPASNASSAEVTRIFANTLRTGALPPDDVRYVGQIVAQRSGLTQQEAEKRVTETYARAQAKLHEAESTARVAADQARKASAQATLWLFISLLIGAFVASLAATFGGRQRDA
jgi:hypothetical protein